MKKVLFLFVFTILFSANALSQTIDEKIPKFVENLFIMNRNSVEIDLENRGFDIYKNNDLLSLGWDEENATNGILAIGDYDVVCKVFFSEDGKKVLKVITIVKYPNFRLMESEYKMSGYILDEKESSRNELVYLKRDDKYYYFAFVEFNIAPNMCGAITEFRKVEGKH